MRRRTAPSQTGNSSVYIHEFSGGALVFSLVLPLGLLSLAASLQASRNHVPGIKDILVVLWCLLVPFLFIFLLRSPEPEGKSYSAPFHEQKLPINKRGVRLHSRTLSASGNYGFSAERNPDNVRCTESVSLTVPS